MPQFSAFQLKMLDAKDPQSFDASKENIFGVLEIFQTIKQLINGNLER